MSGFALRSRRVASRVREVALSYAELILSHNPLAYWRLNETSGTVAVNAQGDAARDGTLVGAVQHQQPGMVDKSIHFDTDEYMEALVADYATATVEMWVKPDTIASGYRYLWCAAIGTNTEAMNHVYIHSDGSTTWEYYDGTWRVAPGLAAGTIKFGEWNHIVCTWQNGYQQMWHNGTAATATAWGTVFTTGDRYRFMAHPQLTAGSGLAGSLDEVAFWDSVLTETQVLEHYNKSSAIETYEDIILADSPVGYWRLSETSGTTAVASAGANGTYRGSPTLGATGAIVGESDLAVNFDAAGDYLTVPNPKTVPDVGSIEAWVHTGTWGDAGEHGIFQSFQSAAWNNQPNSVSLFRWTGSNGSLYFRCVSSGGTLYDIMPDWTTIMTANAWNHIVGTWDATHMRLYIDGVEKANRTYVPPTGFPDTTVAWARGHDKDMRGIGDEFAMYDVALTATQVKAHYDKGIGL